MELTDIKTVRNLLERYGFTFSKSLGQNFLINPAIPVKIAEGSGVTKEDKVLEIGPGFGCLTRELSLRAGSVTAVEIDKRLIPVLSETLEGYDNVTVINQDILQTDIKSMGRISVVANLPYYITTPIMMYLLESGADIKSITVMVQKELARRFVAPAGSPDYGSVTAAISYYADAKVLFNVSAGSFMPAPKVDSSVVRLDLRPPTVSTEPERLFKVIRAAFSMRRKTLVNNLSSVFPIGKEELSDVLSSVGLSPSVRGETLDIKAFAALTDALYERIK